MNNGAEDFQKGITIGEQRYLKELHGFAISSEKLITTTVVASLLKVNPASVTDMLKRLAAKDLLEYSPYHGCRLTEKGEEEASIVIRKCKLIKLFLRKTLDLPSEEIEKIADFVSGLQCNIFFDKIEETWAKP